MRMLRNGAVILGVRFILPLMLSAQTFTTLYTFGSQTYDGANPQGGAVLGPQGELYGITAYGGRWDHGTVYELVPPASPGGAWTEVVLHSFSADGLNPSLGLVMGPNGSLYGVAGPQSTREVAFKLDPPAGTSTDWTYIVIYQFTQADGNPSGGLVFGSPLGYGQSLYGSTDVPNGKGTVFRLTPPSLAGGAWTQTTLYTFPGGSMGSIPVGSLAAGLGGALFGMTTDGGRINEFCPIGCGTVFSLTPPAAPGGPWTEEVLHALAPKVDGNDPEAGMVIGPGGVLYGATQVNGSEGGGTVFSLTPPTVPGTPMTESILHAFGLAPADHDPSALVLGPNGVLYGTTELGGASNYGAVFELAPPASPGGSWTGTILHSFTDGADGRAPSGIALGPDGTLYGTALTGGTNSVGTVFVLTP